MRNIKFRMWHKQIKKMYGVGLINFEQGLIFMKNYLEYTQSSFAIEEVELMQYTGLKDKNGKEIYEGDIIKTKYSIREYLCHIEYSEEYAQFETKCKENVLNDEPLGDLYESRIEVIGNIYDNPELLEKENK